METRVRDELGRELTLLCSFHPSQQNTFTGRLTEAMLDDIFTRAATKDLGRIPLGNREESCPDRER